jgi:hypothetical protein
MYVLRYIHILHTWILITWSGVKFRFEIEVHEFTHSLRVQQRRYSGLDISQWVTSYDLRLKGFHFHYLDKNIIEYVS